MSERNLFDAQRCSAGQQLVCNTSNNAELLAASTPLTSCQFTSNADPTSGTTMQASPHGVTTGDCAPSLSRLPRADAQLVSSKEILQANGHENEPMSVRAHSGQSGRSAMTLFNDATQQASSLLYGINTPIGTAYSVYPTAQPMHDKSCHVPDAYNVQPYSEALRSGGQCAPCEEGKPMSAYASPYLRRKLAAYERTRNSTWGCPNLGYATFPGSALVPAPEDTNSCHQ